MPAQLSLAAPYQFLEGTSIVAAEKFAEVAAREIGEKRAVRVSVCASHIGGFAGAIFTNTLKQILDAQLLDGTDVPCALHEERCTRNTVLPVLSTYQQRPLTEQVIESFALIPNLHLISGASAGMPENFYRRFSAWLGKVDGQREISWESTKILSWLAYYAAQNVLEHAYRKPLEQQPEILSSYLSLKVHHDNPEEIPGEAYAEFRARNAECDRYLEIIVNDDGVGIPARQAQDRGIYYRSFDEEQRVLEDALREGGTAKFSANDLVYRGIPGRGTAGILDTARRLGAYVAVRTGRHLMAFNGTDNAYTPQGDELAYVPGTTIYALVPLPAKN